MRGSLFGYGVVGFVWLVRVFCLGGRVGVVGVVRIEGKNIGLSNWKFDVRG